MQTTILVVDDEPDLREAMSESLKDFYSIATAEDGQDALNFIHSQKPDLILLDLRMPRMDGFQALSILKQNKNTADIPVIVITAYGRMDNILEAERLRASDFLIKPFQTAELLNIVRAVLKRVAPKADIMPRFFFR